MGLSTEVASFKSAYLIRSLTYLCWYKNTARSREWIFKTQKIFKIPEIFHLKCIVQHIFKFGYEHGIVASDDNIIYMGQEKDHTYLCLIEKKRWIILTSCEREVDESNAELIKIIFLETALTLIKCTLTYKLYLELAMSGESFV